MLVNPAQIPSPTHSTNNQKEKKRKEALYIKASRVYKYGAVKRTRTSTSTLKAIIHKKRFREDRKRALFVIVIKANKKRVAT
jgi:hypothetical protein